VLRAATSLGELTDRKHRQFKASEAAAERRMREQKAQQERRAAEKLAAAELRQQNMEKARQHQQELEEQRRKEMIEEQKRLERRLELRAAEQEEARQQQIQESELMKAASRKRVESRMSEIQTHLLQLEDQLEERAAKVEVFSSARETDQQEGQRLAVRSAVERARLSNSMIQLRLCPTSHGTSHVLELPKDRRDAHDKELKAVFDRVDPQGQGRISLPSVKKAVTKMVPSPPPPSRRPRSVTASSQSMPSLYKPALKEKSTASLHEKCMAVFTAADTDGTGTISKRELMAALKKAGLNETRTALNMFQGFDVNDDGELTFEEFFHIAEKVLI